MLQVLFIEDNEDLAFAITESLVTLGDYEIAQAYNGKEGMELYHKIKPEIVISDVEMPKMNGFEVIQAIRAIDKQCILFLATGLCSSKDIVKGFDLGVDEYVKKPYSAIELHARIQAILHRFKKPLAVEKHKTEHIKNIGKYQFDTQNKCLYFNAKKTRLTAKEFGILEILHNHKNNLVSREKITDDLWGETDFFTSRSLDVFITKLRKYFSEDPKIKITTVRGEGILLED